jgi:hypothetical protein
MSWDKFQYPGGSIPTSKNVGENDFEIQKKYFCFSS